MSHHHDDAIAPDLDPGVENARAEKGRKRTLGNVRLRHRETREIILIPAPSEDPNDPLNWSQWYKYYMASVICLAMMICNFLAAGPSIAILETSLEFFPETPVPQAIARVAYFFTTTALLQGTGNFFWVPIANKYGRRPVYVASYALYLATAIWLVFEKSYGGFLAGRILMGFGAGAAETIAPISIADVFFLHERGAVMALYTSFLSIGVGFGMLISGLITINHDWRVIYQVASALVGLILLLAFFGFPETAFSRRVKPDPDNVLSSIDTEKPSSAGSDIQGPRPRALKKESYVQSLKIFHKTRTEESLVRMFFRPLGLITLPPVLWAALVQAVTIGFLVAVSSNVSPAYKTAYGFDTYQVGLCFIATIIGSILGIPAGGLFGDFVADFFTKRNGGVREPEMRLPAICLSLVTTPLALILFGAGIHNRFHWMCPTIALGLLNFSIAQGTNICLVYVIDAYRPIAGEITLSVLGFKSLFGFLLSFYTNPWVEQAGYQDAYGAMAGVSAAVLIMWVPLYFWGKKIRHATWQWPVITYIHWSDDREVGE